MTGFDPAAATAAWLARVPQAAEAAAERHAQAAMIVWVLGWMAPVLLAALLVRWRVFERVWDWGERRGRLVALGCVVLAFAAISAGFELALQVVGRVADVSASPATVLARFVLVAVGYGVLSLAGSRPRLAFAALALALSFVIVFGPTLLSELGPARPPASGPAAQAALDIAHVSGVAASRVELSPSAGEGDVVGLLHAPRIVLTPEAAASADLAEVRAGVGHVLGHWRAHDQMRWALVLGALAAGGAQFVGWLYRPVGKLLGGHEPPELSDPRGVPVVWALVAVWLALANPVALAFDRAINLAADRFSLDHAREPDGLVRALMHQGVGGCPVDPPLAELLVACSHPPLKARIAQATAWKAEHPKP